MTQQVSWLLPKINEMHLYAHSTLVFMVALFIIATKGKWPACLQGKAVSEKVLIQDQYMGKL